MEVIKKRPKALLSIPGADYARLNLDPNTKTRLDTCVDLINSSRIHVPVSRSTVCRMAIARLFNELQAELKKLATLPELDAHRLESRLRTEVVAANKAGRGERGSTR